MPGSRSADYTAENYFALVRAWLSFSEGPVVGSEQKYLEFFAKVADLFALFKPTTTEGRSVSLSKQGSS